MRRNDEPTRYGFLMFIGDISIDTIVDGILIYDSTCLHHWLVGGLEPWNCMTFHSVGNFIIPTDFHSMIFQRGRWLNHQAVKNVDLSMNTFN